MDSEGIEIRSKKIGNGQTDVPGFNFEEHEGLCKADSALIGTPLFADYARGCFEASGYVACSQAVLGNNKLPRRVIWRM